MKGKFNGASKKPWRPTDKKKGANKSHLGLKNPQLGRKMSHLLRTPQIKVHFVDLTCLNDEFSAFWRCIFPLPLPFPPLHLTSYSRIPLLFSIHRKAKFINLLPKKCLQFRHKRRCDLFVCNVIAFCYFFVQFWLWGDQIRIWRSFRLTHEIG